MILRTIAVCALTLLMFSTAHGQTALSVQTVPPVVVKTFPAAGETSVDPSIKEIRVTFSKDMMTENMWSWVYLSKDTFPEITGKVRFIDKRTCVAPVKLAPGKTYAIWFNSRDGKYRGFRDRANTPAVPYLLVFQTKK